MARAKDKTLSLNSPDLKVRMVDFLCFYSGVVNITTDKELNKRYPTVKPFVLSLFNKHNLIIKTNLELASYNFSTIGKDTLVFSKKNTKTLCLLRHIRNAIAHWNIQQYSDGSVTIRDFKDNSKSKITCYGILSIENLYQLLNIKNS